MPSKASLRKVLPRFKKVWKIERATGALLYESYILGLLADACIKNERYGQALEFLDQAQLRLDEKNSGTLLRG